MNLSRRAIIICALALVVIGVTGLYLLYWRFLQPFPTYTALHGFIFYSCLFQATIGATVIVSLLLQIPIKKAVTFSLALSSIYLGVALAEIGLRHSTLYASYIETRMGFYQTAYTAKSENVLYNIQPNYSKLMQSAEFCYPRIPNNMGFRDVDFFPKQDTNAILIQTYGDSFTEGDGAPADSSYPAQLRKMLSRKGGFIVQNFGVCASDPAFSYKQLDSIGVELKPNFIVITYSSFDFTADFFTRGGLDRFKAGYWEGLKGPGWEWLYACSHVFRAFINLFHNTSSGTFLLTAEQAEMRLNALKPKWNETFLRIADICRAHDIKVLLIKKPEAHEIFKKQYNCNFSFFEHMADTISTFKRYDLLDYYIKVADVNQQNWQQYYWPVDGHHNSTGYHLMAKGVLHGLYTSFPETFAKPLNNTNAGLSE